MPSLSAAADAGRQAVWRDDFADDLKMIARISVRAVLLIAVVATIGCDRVTKHVARAALAGEPGRSYLADTIRLEYVENAGGFLSLGASLPSSARTALFTLGTGVMLVTLLGAAVRFRWRGWLLIGTSLVLAGGASNWVDRLVRGSVVDFLNIGVGPLRTGIFNVADMAIMLGVAVLLLAQRHRSDDVRPTGDSSGQTA